MNIEDCLFCKIIKKDIPADIVYSDQYVVAFKDINPMAKEHYLFIPRDHSDNFVEMLETNSILIEKIYKAIDNFCIKNSLNKSGYRVVINTGRDAGQTVFHTHFHLLGGQLLSSFGAQNS